MSKLNSFFILSAGLLLMSCSSVPLTSLPKLAAVKPETMDMSQMELAVRIPEQFGIHENSANLSIKLENEMTGETLFKNMTLGQSNPELTAYLSRQEKPGYKVYRFKMTPAQLVEAEKFRQSALAFRSQGTNSDNEMTLKASAGFCRVSEGDLDHIDMTFFVRTRNDKDFFKLFKERTLPIVSSGKGMNIPFCHVKEQKPPRE